jgi:hypothetical protein
MVTLALVGIGVASSPPHIDVTKSLAGLGAGAFASKEYSSRDTQMLWYLQMNDALMCVKYNTVRLEEGVKQKPNNNKTLSDRETLSDLETLELAAGALGENMSLLRRELGDTQKYLTDRNLPYGTVYELLAELNDTYTSAISVKETIMRAPTDIEQELHNINTALLRKYVSASPDINAITASITNYVKTATSNINIAKPSADPSAAIEELNAISEKNKEALEAGSDAPPVEFTQIAPALANALYAQAIKKTTINLLSRKCRSNKNVCGHQNDIERTNILLAL